MSECVVRMEMPAEHCMDCPYMVSRDNDDCILQSDEANERAESWEDLKAGCPFICALPEGHGRLVDADACASVLKKLENEAVRPTEKLCYGYSAKMFEEAYTIVPAEAERSET